MATEWKQYHWGDLATLEYGKGLRGYENGTGPYPVYGTNGPVGYHSEPLCKYSGVIIGRKGAYRGVHYSNTPFYVIDTAFYLKPKIDIDLKWAYYQLLTQDINNLDSGSAIPSTSREDFYALPVDLPPLPEQRAIAAVLGALDDKIEVNRRMNQTLEQIAQALFKSWFVDFDPVHANRNGEAMPGLAREVQALFPNAFEDSTLGEIPQGWRVGKLSKIVDFNPSRRLQKDQIAPYLDMGNMPTTSARALEWFDRPFNSGSRFKNGDVLLARITPCLENGKTAYVDFLASDQIGWGSTEYIVMRALDPLPSEYVYFIARDETFRAFAIQSMSGTSGRQRVPVDAVAAFEVVIPNETAAEYFGAFARNAFVQMKANDEQSRTLAATRDALLPKLLSGEVRVREVEKMIEEIM